MYKAEEIQSEQVVNTDLSTWGKQFSDALKSGQKPEADLFNGMKNEFDEEEWMNAKWNGGKVEEMQSGKVE